MLYFEPNRFKQINNLAESNYSKTCTNFALEFEPLCSGEKGFGVITRNCKV